MKSRPQSTLFSIFSNFPIPGIKKCPIFDLFLNILLANAYFTNDFLFFIIFLCSPRNFKPRKIKKRIEKEFKISLMKLNNPNNNEYNNNTYYRF